MTNIPAWALALVCLAVLVGACVFLISRQSNSQIASTQKVSPASPANYEKFIFRFQTKEVKTSFCGLWKEVVIDGHRISFQPHSIYIGDFDPNREQLSEIYLGRVNGDTPLPHENSKQRLDSFVGPEGTKLAQQYFLCATGREDYPELRIPKVRDNLLTLSPYVREVMFFEGNTGIQLQFDFSKATPEAFENDLKVLQEIYSAVKNK